VGNIFFTADTHLGHDKILKYASDSRGHFSSIEEHDEDLIERWNSFVGPDDIVWHLGDVCFGRSGFNSARRLNGDKRLILGNHDILPAADYLQLFTDLHGSVKFKGVVLLSHIPAHPQQLDKRFSINFHGHLHCSNLDDPRYINVGVDRWSLAPVAWEDLKQILDNRL
jgi:calcineurin-like phosphoesterase family protein